MTADEIRRIVDELRAVRALAQESGLYIPSGIHDFRLDDLKLAAEIYGGEIVHCEAEKPFDSLRVGKVTLFT